MMPPDLLSPACAAPDACPERVGVIWRSLSTGRWEKLRAGTLAEVRAMNVAEPTPFDEDPKYGWSPDRAEPKVEQMA